MQAINNFFQQYQNAIGEDDIKLTTKFSFIFSRFEYAVIRSGFFHVNTGKVNWDIYLNTVIDSFSINSTAELESSCNYLLNNPPNKRTTDDNGNLIWETMNFQDNMHNLRKIMFCLRTIRNNLFHGNKYPFDGVRDRGLIKKSLVIIDYLISLSSEELQEHFWAGFAPPAEEIEETGN